MVLTLVGLFVIYVWWDGMGYTVGTGVATAQKIVQRPTTFLPGLPKNNLHHDHVCTDEFTQTG